jgi:nitrogen regulatory protein PII
MSGESLNAVVAFIQPFQLESVVNALRRMPRFPGISVSEVRGFGRHGAHPPQVGELAEVVPLEKKIRLEIYCLGSEATSILQTIRQAAQTGHQGDGKVFVVDVAWAMRIRTGEIGVAAIGGGGGHGDSGGSEPIHEG